MPFDGNPEKIEVKLTLIAARELVAARWCKKALRKEWKHGPAFCAVGAIRQTVYGNAQGHYPELRLGTEAMEALRLAIEFKPYERPEIVDWNDAHERKKAEVLAVFDKAIAGCG